MEIHSDWQKKRRSTKGKMEKSTYVKMEEARIGNSLLVMFLLQMMIVVVPEYNKALINITCPVVESFVAVYHVHLIKYSSFKNKSHILEAVFWHSI